MLKSTAVAHYKTDVAVARALGLSRQAVSKWGNVVPKGAAAQLQIITNGLLQIDHSLYPPPNHQAETGP